MAIGLKKYIKEKLSMPHFEVKMKYDIKNQGVAIDVDHNRFMIAIIDEQFRENKFQGYEKVRDDKDKLALYLQSIIDSIVQNIEGVGNTRKSMLEEEMEPLQDVQDLYSSGATTQQYDIANMSNAIRR